MFGGAGVLIAVHNNTERQAKQYAVILKLVKVKNTNKSKNKETQAVMQLTQWSSLELV